MYFRLRDQILFYSTFVGFIKSIYFGLYDIMIAIIQQLQDLSAKISDTSIASFVQNVEQAISARMQMKIQFSMKD